MAVAPRPPSIAIPLVDSNGRLSQEWYKYFTGGVSYTQNVNSGVSEARAAAAQAQATANAATQAAVDVAVATLPFTASANSYYALGAQVGTGTLTTDAVTVTPSGGTGPYTYAWAYVSGYASFTTNSPTSATTDWTGTLSTPGQERSATYRCTVTDSLAATATITVGVSIVELS